MGSCLYGLIQHLLFGQWHAVQERLHWDLSKTVLPTMVSCLVVFLEPSIQIGLEFVKAVIDLLAEGDLVEFLQEGLVEAFADAVGLRASRLGS